MTSSATQNEATPEAATTTEVTLTDFSVVNDNARVEDEQGYLSKVGNLLVKATAAGMAAVNDAGAKTALGWARIDVRGSIQNANGFPDWGGETSIYQLIVGRVETNALQAVPGMTEGTLKKIQDAVRAQLSRGILRQGVVRHVVTTEAKYGKYLDRINTPEKLADFAAKPPIEIQRRVREHYHASKNLKKTDPYPPQSGGAGGAGNVGTTDTVLAAFKRSVKAVSDGGIVPSLATEGIYSELQGVGRQLHGPNVPEVEKLPEVLATLAKIERLAGLLRRSRDASGKALSDAELAKLAEMIEVPNGDDDAADDAADDADGTDADDGTDAAAADAAAVAATDGK